MKKCLKFEVYNLIVKIHYNVTYRKTHPVNTFRYRVEIKSIWFFLQSEQYLFVYVSILNAVKYDKMQMHAGNDEGVLQLRIPNVHTGQYLKYESIFSLLFKVSNIQLTIKL